MYNPYDKWHNDYFSKNHGPNPEENMHHYAKTHKYNDFNDKPNINFQNPTHNMEPNNHMENYFNEEKLFTHNTMNNNTPPMPPQMPPMYHMPPMPNIHINPMFQQPFPNMPLNVYGMPQTPVQGLPCDPQISQRMYEEMERCHKHEKKMLKWYLKNCGQKQTTISSNESSVDDSTETSDLNEDESSS